MHIHVPWGVVLFLAGNTIAAKRRRRGSRRAVRLIRTSSYVCKASIALLLCPCACETVCLTRSAGITYILQALYFSPPSIFHGVNSFEWWRCSGDNSEVARSPSGHRGSPRGALSAPRFAPLFPLSSFISACGALAAPAREKLQRAETDTSTECGVC